MWFVALTDVVSRAGFLNLSTVDIFGLDNSLLWKTDVYAVGYLAASCLSPLDASYTPHRRDNQKCLQTLLNASAFRGISKV